MSINTARLARCPRGRILQCDRVGKIAHGPFAIVIAVPGNFAHPALLHGMDPPDLRLWGYPRLPTSANMAPCGSLAWTIQLPPGTSIGPLAISPPAAFTRSTAASKSPTLK